MSFKKKAPEDDGPPMGHNLPDDLAAAPESDSSGSRSVGRRSFMKGATVGVGSLAAGGFSLRYGTQEADALAVTTAIGIGLAGAAVGAYVGNKIGQMTGDDRDYSGYTGADALWQEVEYGVTQMQTAKEQVLSSLLNTAEFSKHVALPKGMAAVVEALNSGGDESAATTAMQEAIDDYYSGVQADVITHFDNQMRQFYHLVQQVDNHENLDHTTDVFYYESADRNGTGFYTYNTYQNILTESSYQLLNGESVTFMCADYIDSNNDYTEIVLHPTKTEVGSLSVLPHGYTDVSERIELFGSQVYADLIASLITARDEVNAELSTFVSDTYSQYAAGDIDLADYVDPITAYTELSSDQDEFAFAGAAANMLGIPRNEAPLDVYLHESDSNVIGSIYSTNSPEGGFSVGQTYDPSVLSYPVFLRYEGAFEDANGETVTEVDFVQLDQEFTIESAQNPDGSEATEVTVSEGPTYDPADVATLQEQLNQIREEQLAMQEEAQTGGGSFSFDQFAIGDIPGVATIAMIGGGILLLLNDDD